MRGIKINRFLHKNQHAQRKFRYFVNKEWGAIKNWAYFYKIKILKMIEIENVINKSCCTN